MNKKLLNIGNVRYAPKEHNHDEKYSNKEHNHDKSYSLTSHEHTNVKSSGLLAPQTGRTQELGDLYTYKTDSSVSGQPTPWSVILGWGIDGKCGVEICANYVQNDGLWYRTLRDFGDNWYNWDRIYTTQHKPTLDELNASPKIQTTPLWSGSLYMKAGQVIHPSKKLSDCQTGWLLVWGDYSPNTSATNNWDFNTTVVRKESVNGYSTLHPIVLGWKSTSIATKYIVVHNDRLEGHETNEQDPSNKATLRWVYEF